MNIDPELVNKAIAGGSGSAVAAYLAKLNGWPLVLATLAGMAIAWFVGPMVADFFELKKEEARSGVAFLSGFLGLMVLRKVVDTVEAIDPKTIGKSIQESISSWFPKKPGG